MSIVAPFPDGLSALMEFDSVIQVLPNRTVDTDPADPQHAPEGVYLDVDADTGQATDAGPWIDGTAEWSLITGYSSQQGYSGPIMHASEQIGGRMAEDILNRPGYYVAMSVECIVPETGERFDAPWLSDEPAGWAIAFREVGI